MGSIKGVPRGKYLKNNMTSKTVHCSKCGKSYKRKALLDHHIMIKHLNYHVNCPLCSNKFTSVSEASTSISAESRAAQDFDFTYLHRLNFEGQRSFPHMANILALKHDDQFGNHIVANCDIDVGKVVIATSPFAAYEFFSSIDERCFHCGKKKTSHF